MNIFLIFGFILAAIIIEFFVSKRRINWIFIISSIFIFGLTIFIGHTILNQVINALPTDNNTTTGIFSLFGTTECTAGEYIPVTDIQKQCKDLDRTISIQSCDKTGRVCTSKSIDCATVNSEGISSVGQNCSSSNNILFILLVIPAIIVIFMVFFSGITKDI